MIQSDPAKQPFLRQVTLRNFKSIGKCALSLRPLTVLVGRNGSGKSNFLDALRFVADGLQTSLDHAIKSRGGIDDVRRRSAGHPRNFAIELEIALPDWQVARYGFEIAGRRDGGFAVKSERLRVCQGTGRLLASYDRSESTVTASFDQMPPLAEDRLYLVNAAGLQDFRPTYDALASMGFYNLNPEAMKELQKPDAGELLHSDGSNIASVVARLGTDQEPALERIKDYLKTIVPDITGLERVALGPRETLQFRQRIEGSEYPWKFYASSMSDGTLRALGALVAVAQLAGRKRRVPLVGIEEPETALHPAAAGALVSALREVTEKTQVLLTSHSADLLDEIDLDHDSLIVVQAKGGTTELGPVDAASREAIRQHLYSPGELLRMDQLQPDPEDVRRQQQQQELEFTASSEPQKS